jgi:hypothetical protein
MNNENNNNKSMGTSNQKISPEMAVCADTKCFIKYASNSPEQSIKLIGLDLPKTLVIIYRFLYFCGINIIRFIDEKFI